MKKMFLFVSMVFILGITSSFAEDIQKAYFAGGCFWCMESGFQEEKGVQEVYSGYIGTGEKPTYQEVGRGNSGFVESVEVIYDADVIDYQTLLNIYWRQFDPTDADGQFTDRGSQYRPFIYYTNAEEKKLAEASKRNLDKSGWIDGPIATDIVPLTNFYKAEEYHQDYFLKASKKYKIYRKGSGRDRYLNSVWGKKVDPRSPIQKKS